MNATTETRITCPRCGSPDWRCYDETSRECWDKNGEHAGTRVIGALACNACGAAWLDYSVDPALDDQECECEEY